MTDIDVQRFGKWGKAEGEASECVIMRWSNHKDRFIYYYGHGHCDREENESKQ